MIIESACNLGDIVYLKTDKEQLPRIITGIIIRPSGCGYYLSCGVGESLHYDFEFSYEENVILKTGN